MKVPRGIPLIILAILLLIPFHRVFLYGEYLTGTDANIPLVEPFVSEFPNIGNKPWEFALRQDGFLQTLPGKYFTQQQLKDGEIPLWNPYIFCGTPHEADMYSQLFAITDTPFLYFMSVDAALTVATILKILLLGFGMYFVARRLGIRWELACISSLVMCFSFQQTQWFEVPAFLSTMLYLPWMFLAWDKYLRCRRIQWVFLLGILGGLSILGGQGQIFATIWIILLLYTLFGFEWRVRKRRFATVGWLAGGFIVSLLIGWVQIYPAMQFVALSKGANPEASIWAHFRNESINFVTGGWKQIVTNVVRIFAPFRYYEPDQWYYKQHKELIIYLGFLAPAALYALWRRKRERFQNYLWWVAWISMLIIVFNTIIELIFGIVPFMQFQNIRRIAALLFNFHMALLIPYVLEALIPKTDLELARRFRRAWFAIIIITVLYTLYVVYKIHTYGYTCRSFLLVFYYLAIGAMFLYRWFVIEGNIRKGSIYFIVLIAVFLELWNFSNHLILTSRTSVGALRDASVESIAQSGLDGISGRIYRYSPENMYQGVYLNPNTGVLVCIPDAQGYNPLNAYGYRHTMEQYTAWDGRPNPRYIPDFRHPEQFETRALPRILNIQGVGFGDLDEGNWRFQGEKKDRAMKTYALGSIDSLHPAWAFVFYDMKDISPDDFYVRLSRDQLDLANTAYIMADEGDIPREMKAKSDTGIEEAPRGADAITNAAQIVHEPGHNRVENVALAYPGVLLFSENNYPGWRVEVDGEPAEILTVDGSLMGVKLNAGTHTVDFRFIPLRFRIGLWVSVLSLLISFLILIFASFSSKRPPLLS